MRAARRGQVPVHHALNRRGREAAMIRCPGHHFNGPIESLTGDSTDTRDPGTAGLGSRAGRDSLRGSNDDRHGGGFAPRDLLTEPEPNVRRPNTAPAYDLGRPARLWITVMRPRRRPAASHHRRPAVTGGGERTLSRCGGPAAGAGAGTACVTPATTSLPACGPGDARLAQPGLRVPAT
jgi:hypothetical protein